MTVRAKFIGRRKQICEQLHLETRQATSSTSETAYRDTATACN